MSNHKVMFTIHQVTHRQENGRRWWGDLCVGREEKWEPQTLAKEKWNKEHKPHNIKSFLLLAFVHNATTPGYQMQIALQSNVAPQPHIGTKQTLRHSCLICVKSCLMSHSKQPTSFIPGTVWDIIEWDDSIRCKVH